MKFSLKRFLGRASPSRDVITPDEKLRVAILSDDFRSSSEIMMAAFGKPSPVKPDPAKDN